MKETPKQNIRLWIAKTWLKNYNGKNLVKGYSKKFGVDKLCAIKELRMIGVEITEDYEQQLRRSIESHIKQQQLKKRNVIESNDFIDSDENFAFIAGYTSGGFPYGITHEASEEMEDDSKIP